MVYWRAGNDIIKLEREKILVGYYIHPIAFGMRSYIYAHKRNQTWAIANSVGTTANQVQPVQDEAGAGSLEGCKPASLLGLSFSFWCWYLEQKRFKSLGVKRKVKSLETVHGMDLSRKVASYTQCLHGWRGILIVLSSDQMPQIASGTCRFCFEPIPKASTCTSIHWTPQEWIPPKPQVVL
jgi:hypothetical protein